VSHAISFIVPDEHYPQIVAYAKAKGLLTPSNIARLALYQRIKSYPVKEGEAFDDPVARMCLKDAKSVHSSAAQAK